MEEITTEVPVVPEEVKPQELPERVFEYQPKDDSGRPLGGKQVLKYRTQEELTEKLVQQNVNLVRELRKETRKNRLGVQESEIIPETAPKFNAPLQFNPRELSPDERVGLSRDLLDPEKFKEATDVLFEASLGAKPDKLRQEFSEMSQQMQGLTAKIESDAFMESNPDYYPCPENFEAITGWMLKNDLAPVRSNFKLAFETLKRLPGGVIIGKPENEPSAPVEVLVPTSVPEPVPTPVPVPEPVVPKVVPPPTGLRDNGGANMPPKTYKYTLSEINKMPADVYKKNILGTPGFAQMVEALEKEAAAKSRERR